MLVFLPIGLDDMKVGRWPVVSIGLAVTCVVLFLMTSAELDAQAVRAWGLVPAEGAVQVGWITYMFLHADWMHVLGNLLFLYVAAPYVEDAWGVGRFLVLYFVGGLVAGLGQLALDPSSTIPIIGASGAIAACIGAFCVQFPRRKVRMFWLFLRVTGTFFVPVWLWGGFWFAKELFYLAVQGGGSGVAFGAHLGGFAFGAVMAVAIIKLQGNPFELRYGRPSTPVPVPAPSHRPIPSLPPKVEPVRRSLEPVVPARASVRSPTPRPREEAPATQPTATRPFPTKPRLRGES